jgi:hypothetical protein
VSRAKHAQAQILGTPQEYSYCQGSYVNPQAIEADQQQGDGDNGDKKALC